MTTAIFAFIAMLTLTAAMAVGVILGASLLLARAAA